MKVQKLGDSSDYPKGIAVSSPEKDEKVLKISQLADNKKLELGFITIIDILRMEEICRNQDRDSKDYEVYHRLCAKGIEVEFEDVIEILKIEELTRKGNL